MHSPMQNHAAMYIVNADNSQYILPLTIIYSVFSLLHENFKTVSYTAHYTWSLSTLSDLQESCFCYWPTQNGASAVYGKLKVTLRSQETCMDYVVRKLEVTDDKQHPGLAAVSLSKCALKTPPESLCFAFNG